MKASIRMNKKTIQIYYRLTKPGIIRGNAITTTGGFLLASKGQFDIWLFVATLVGISAVIASACVVNNYIDRSIDAKMKRTKKRALVTGAISVQSAIVFALALGISGVVALSFTNLLTTVLAIMGFVFYVLFYGIAKRKTVHGTLVGSVSGAIPIVVGYCAVSQTFDIGAWLLFFVMVFWQMPHFYAIALYRLEDYRAAHIPVLPLRYSIQTTKLQILLYIVGFVLATYTMTLFDYTGYIYLFVMAIMGVWWLYIAIRGFGTDDYARWARGVFSFSLKVLLVFSIMISLEAWLP